MRLQTLNTNERVYLPASMDLRQFYEKKALARNAASAELCYKQKYPLRICQRLRCFVKKTLAPIKSILTLTILRSRSSALLK